MNFIISYGIFLFLLLCGLALVARAKRPRRGKMKEFVDWIDTWRNNCGHRAINSCDICDSRKQCLKAIKELRSHLRKERIVSREFVERWVKKWMQDDANFIQRELSLMLKELGYEIEEKK